NTREFELLLKSPIIHASKKISILQSVLEGKVSDITYTFVKLLAGKGREAYLQDIAEAFIRQYNSFNNITPVKFTSATKIDQSVIDQLMQTLKKEASLDTVELVTEVDQDLIGGFVLQYEDKLVDASIRRSIETLKKDFSNSKFVKKI